MSDHKHHSKLAPSSFPGLQQCAYFRSGGGTADTSKGTELHGYVEDLYIGKIQPSDIQENDRYNCVWAAGRVENLVALYPPDGDVVVEPDLELLDSDGKQVTFGHSDFLWKSGEIVVVPDLKGCLDFNPEAHYYDPQFACYALMSMQLHDVDRAFCPEINIKPQKQRDFWFTYDEAAAIVQGVVEKVGSEDKRHQVCFSCKFCARLLTCPAINKMHQAIATLCSFGALDPEVINDLLSDKPKPLNVSRVYTFSKLMKKWAENVQAKAKELAESGMDLPFYEPFQRAGRQSISNNDEAFERCTMLDASEFQSAVSVSISKLGEVYSAKSGMSKKAAQKEIVGVLDELVVRGSSSTQLKFVADKIGGGGEE